MIYKPKYLEPKNKAIDATVYKVFSWQSQGELQTHYQVRIYELPNTLVHNSSKWASSENEYVLPPAMLTNGKEYKWTVETFGASGSAVSNAVYLKTSASPVVALTVPASLTVQSYKVTATYAHASGVSIKQHKFILYDSNDKIINDTGWRYDYDLSYTLDGLLSGNTYKVEFIAIDQNDLSATSGKQSFTVSYVKPDATRSIILKPNNNKGVMLVRWDTLKSVTPTVTGTYSYVEGKFEKGLKIDPESYLEYNEPTEEYFTHQIFRRFPLDYEGKILEMDDDFTLGFENGVFYVINQNVRFVSQPVDLSNILEDIAYLTLEEVADTYATLGDLILYPDLITFLFIQLTFEQLIVKRNGRIIAHIDMRV